MTTKKDWYFGKTPVKGAGDFFFLVLLRSAGEGEEGRSLIGSFAKEIDYGLFSGKACPEPTSALDPGLAGTQLAQANQVSVDKVYSKSVLSGADQSFASLKKFGIDGKGGIPGTPASLGVSFDYKKISTIDVEFGAGSYFLELRTGYLDFGIRAIRKAPDAYHPAFLDKDYMIINRVLIVRNLKLVVKAKTVFGADVEAGVAGQEVPGLKIGFDSTSKKTITIAVEDGKDYLFGISGVQPEKY